MVMTAPSHAASCARAWRPGTVTHPSVNFGNMPVPASKPNGWVIAERFLDMDDAVCEAGTETFAAKMEGTATIDPSVYATNVPGVGVRVTPAYDQGNRAYAPFQNTVSSASPITFSQWRLKVELIKTGPIEAGTGLSGLFYSGDVLGAASGFRSTASFGGGSFTPISCITEDVTVRMPTISLASLTRGTVAGRRRFQIAIHCASSDALTGIDYQFSTSMPIVDATQGVIGLDGTSTAKGVGIQVTDEQSSPIQFQHRYTLSPFLPGQLQYQIPLNAAYYSTGAVQAGSVSSEMEFTLFYR